MGSKRKQVAKRKRDVEVEEQDLERFAGSSDEEQNNESDDDDNESVISSEKKLDDVHYDADEQSVDSPSQTRQEDSHDEVDSDEEQERDRRSKGMANAMARILGTETKSAQSVVLSKTKTPIQKLAEQEKQKEKELREKRQANREKQLVAFHEPLSVATLSTLITPDGSNTRSSISKELEQERILRRVATRGVVALFNAISQHQNKSNEPSENAAEHKNEPVRKMTKHGFLDMIKAKATSLGKTDDADDNNQEKKQNWNALQDDFLLRPKKNWDQESSSEEEDDDGNISLEGDDDDDSEVDDKPQKKQKLRNQ